MGIQRLPATVVSSLRSDVTVTTTAQCVTELVLNSIDAGATAIAVRIDLKNFRIQVVDNGCGLSKSDLNVVGTRYMTSKCTSLHDLQTNLSHFGFRGEALTSITEVCGTITIVSRHHDSEETYCKVFTQGIAHRVGKSRQQRPSCGTTITVADFLYNRPVRRARMKPALDLEEIKTHMESIALINPQISFSLRNDANNSLILQTRRSEDIRTVFGTLFGESVSKHLVPVKECEGPFKVDGYISSEAHLLKNLQFLFVNKRLLLKTKLHKLVNSVMSRSAIIKSNNGPYVPISKEINHGVFLAFSPPKRDKHAIFVLNITCPLSEYDITLDPKKTLVEFCNWDSLLCCFENLLRKFIEKEAGLHTDKGTNLEDTGPRKVKTAADEVNQLAREQALGLNVLRQTEGSISTRDLPRAIHGLPVSRHQVDLSASPSPGCLPSTASSDFTNIIRRKNNGLMSSIPSSAFTEQPFPPNLRNDSSSCKDRDITRVNDPFPTEEPFSPNLRNDSSSCKDRDTTRVNDPFLTETEISSADVSSKSELHCKFKLPQPPRALSKSETKGFVTNTICFDKESFRKETGVLPDGTNLKSSKDTVISSPINALASIKEIRRKKLLKNLSKFSYQISVEKPLLDKAKLPAVKSNIINSKTTIPLHKFYEVNENHAENSIECNLKESLAMQTSIPQERHNNAKYQKPESSLESLKTMHYERYPRKDNSSTYVNASSSNMSKLNLREEQNLKNNSFEGTFVKVIEKGLNQRYPPTFNDTSSVIPTKDSDIQNISQDMTDIICAQECQKILSVEDLVVTAYDLRQAHISSKGTSNIPQCSTKSSMKSIDDIHLSPSTFLTPPETPFFFNEKSLLGQKEDDESRSDSVSEQKNFFELKKMPQETSSISAKDTLETPFSSEKSLLGQKEYDENCFDSISEEQNFFVLKRTSQETCSTRDKDRNYGGENGDVIVAPLNSRPDKAPRKKIVDYDSSPSSSQEMSHSSEDFIKISSLSHNMLKRKPDDLSDDTITKAFISSGSLSSTGNSIELSEEKTSQCRINLIVAPDLLPIQDENNIKMDVEESVMNNEIICGHSEPSGDELCLKKTEDPSPNLNDDRVKKDSLTAPVVSNAVILDPDPHLSFGSQENSDKKETEWVEASDHSGKAFFIHRKSGITTYEQPKTKQENGIFAFNERYLFLPKGMSPILHEKCFNPADKSPTFSYKGRKLVELNVSDSSVDDLTAVKWTNENTEKTDFWPLVDQLLTEADKFSVKLTTDCQVSNACTQELSQSDIKVYNVIFPYCFSKDIFKKLRVLGQLDKKFIVTATTVDNNKEVIVLFDQHAVHERIRVENLTEEYKQHDGSALWKSAPVDPALPLTLSSIEVRILESYMDKMNSLGFFFSVTDSNTISVQRVPTCLLLRENREVTSRGVSVLRQHLESLIREQVDSLLNTRGVGTDHPTIIRNVISSEACKGAVKFGHPLSVADCQAFLHNLSSCSLPFQCAHGRPALVPIVDLSQLKQRNRPLKPNLQKLKRQ